MRVRVTLKELAKSRGRSLYWVAKASGKDYRTIWDFANERRAGMTLNLLEGLCEALECAPGDLFRVEEGGERHTQRAGNKPKP